ncbi:hypothetical protein AZI86_17115 [Bdellovibrio bacteriovorus]|uniref:Uncharacterized protein n=1 Tax=Bdellovibrio bacteriovorus TaxID=959 RepID=A0A150WEQ1_BDEBC|nr:hypothetical protein [Bdellovibrio bacteriovorus]KYG61434.1 hypothetical protein AZI86_17115 [Bdellovibrio bacteriovorus]
MKYVSVAALLFLAACSNPFGGGQSVVDEGHHPGVQSTYPAGAFSEVLSMGKQNSVTPRGYVVSHSAGELSSEVTTTTPRGYQVYSGIQGVFVSETQ